MQAGTSVANLLSLHTFAFSQKWKPVFLIQPVSEDILAMKFDLSGPTLFFQKVFRSSFQAIWCWLVPICGDTFLC